MTVHFDMNAPAVTPRAAATVLLLRDATGTGGGLELFFVRRNAKLQFMGGVYLFPGGKLDEADGDPAVPGTLDEAACASRLGEPASEAGATSLHNRGLFVAAARECLEESGVLLAADAPSLSAEALEALRREVDVEHKPLGAALAERGLTLDLRALVPFARWITPREETRRFDARFFMALAPANALASHDTRETVASEWLAPREALARCDRGEIQLAPPTYRTVQQFAAMRSAREAIERAPTRVPTYEPRAMPDPETEGGFLIVLPGDPLHETPDPLALTDLSHTALGAATRFAYRDGAWKPSATTALPPIA